jgi:hypothetical protein
MLRQPEFVEQRVEPEIRPVLRAGEALRTEQVFLDRRATERVGPLESAPHSSRLIEQKGLPVMSWSTSRIRPDDDWSNPLITLISVVLPAPLGPLTPGTSPAGRLNEMSSNTRRPPNRLVMASACSAGAAARPRIVSPVNAGTELMRASPLRYSDGSRTTPAKGQRRSPFRIAQYPCGDNRASSRRTRVRPNDLGCVCEWVWRIG